jgi:flagellar biosynthesis protein FlhG
VGKTSVAVNLATALTEQGKRVLLFDGDLGLANVDVLLGLSPKVTLEHVLDGRCTLEEAVVDAPQGFKVLPGASGVARMASLSTAEHLGLVQAFSHLTAGLDVLIVDTAAGIADGVRQFCQAAQQVLVVLRDEPASLTDAYALIKVLNRDHGVRRFRILANMSPSQGAGEALYRKLERVANRFLDVVLEYAGEIPEDTFVRAAIREQRSVVKAYPSSAAARAFTRLARQAEKWPAAAGPRGNVEFFIERLLPQPMPRLEAVR